MSLKNKDTKNRWRNKTVAFRISPEEAKKLDVFVKLSGLSKQEYLIRRVLQKEVIVIGNSRVYKMLCNQLVEVLEELERLESVDSNQDELLELILYITEIIYGLKGENNDKR